MSLDAAQRALLRKALGRRKKSELKPLFALIRAHEDRVLLRALQPTPKKKARAKAETLPKTLAKIMSPVLGPAAEKADLLVEHMSKRHRRKLPLTPKGLADATHQLRAYFSDDQIREGATTLVSRLQKLHAGDETVV